MRDIAYLALEDGTIYEGEAFGASGTCVGEVVINTAMMGHQRILSDPTYAQQIVAMSHTQIGNTGANPEDVESPHGWAAGIVVKEYSALASSYRSTGTFGDWLTERGVIGIAGVDTRMLMRQLRGVTSLKGCIASGEQNPDELVQRARAWQGIVGFDGVSLVSQREPVVWTEGHVDFTNTSIPQGDFAYHVVALNFGMRKSLARMLARHSVKVTVLPPTASLEDILSHAPNGVFLSNGPADPAAVPYAIDTVRQLIAASESTGLPIFGVGLGFQFIALAAGGATYKLRLGHRGVNHPVMNHDTGKTEITTQHHGFAVAADSLPDTLRVTHTSLNDKTIDGLEHVSLPVFGVQYNPEAASGPHDATYLFEKFTDYIDTYLKS